MRLTAAQIASEGFGDAFKPDSPSKRGGNSPSKKESDSFEYKGRKDGEKVTIKIGRNESLQDLDEEDDDEFRGRNEQVVHRLTVKDIVDKDMWDNDEIVGRPKSEHQLQVPDDDNDEYSKRSLQEVARDSGELEKMAGRIFRRLSSRGGTIIKGEENKGEDGDENKEATPQNSYDNGAETVPED
mmetsp:Transcript_39093/g.34770  ORF Transcript_39093/g.34770 Transcript_39093/m.34770 type:complete len:184 (+) Transcript_39093:194-745(+)